jgi:hypothetical protein
MKQKFLLFALTGIMAGAVMTACNKDKDEGVDLKNTTLVLTSKSDGSVTTIEFTSATAFTGNKGSTAVSGTYTFVDGTLTLTFANGDTITLNKEGDTFTSSEYTVEATNEGEDNPDPGKNSDSGIVSSITMNDATDAGNESAVITFNYDAQGRVSKVKYGNSFTYSYTYSGSTITVTMPEENYTSTVQLDGQGRAISGSISDYGITTWTANYDGSGYLKRIVSENKEPYGTSTSTIDYTWTNGNLTTVKWTNSNSGSSGTYIITETYVYGTTPAKWGNLNWLSGIMSGNNDEILAMLGYFGKGSSMLPTSANYIEDGESWNTGYTYKFNSFGYVTQIEEKLLDSRRTETTTFAITYK